MYDALCSPTPGMMETKPINIAVPKRELTYVSLSGLTLQTHTTAYVKYTYQQINYPFCTTISQLAPLGHWYVDLTSASLYG